MSKTGLISTYGIGNPRKATLFKIAALATMVVHRSKCPEDSPVAIGEVPRRIRCFEHSKLLDSSFWAAKGGKSQCTGRVGDRTPPEMSASEERAAPPADALGVQTRKNTTRHNNISVGAAGPLINRQSPEIDNYNVHPPPAATWTPRLPAPTICISQGERARAPP